MGMVAEDPIRLVDGRRASCDGGKLACAIIETIANDIGGGPLGHPRVFINLDKPGPKACGYWYVANAYCSKDQANGVVGSGSNRLITTRHPLEWTYWT